MDTPDKEEVSRRNELDGLLTPYAARRLSNSELSSKDGENAKVGWQIQTPIQFKGVCIVFDILFFGEIARCLPKVRVSSPQIEPGELPHVEMNGSLCVWPSRYVIDIDNLNYVCELVHDVYALLRRGVNGELDHDFEEEFQSYWAYHCKSDAPVSTSICDPHKRVTRKIACLRLAGGKVLFADNNKDIEGWLGNRGQLTPPVRKTKKYSRLKKHVKHKNPRRILSRIRPSLLLCFSRVWRPKEYPKTAGEFFSLIREEYPDSFEDVLKQLGEVLISDVESLRPAVLLRFATSNGVSLVSLVFERGLYKQRQNVNGSRFKGNHQEAVMDGFRNVIPLNVLLGRAVNIGTTGQLISRGDASWVLGRDQNLQIKRVGAHKISIVGCGSVGSSIARLLIQSGITNLNVFDGDVLRSENSSRHLIGYDAVGAKKASALAQRLMSEFPHCTVAAFDENWENCADANSVLAASDLILSCTAVWSSDISLIKGQTDYDFPPIVFAFVEPHAVAGHVIVNDIGSGVYESLHYTHGAQVGKMKYPATSWPGETMLRIPACAGEFQPYGSIELTHLHALAARTIMDIVLSESENPVEPITNIWLGSASKLRSLGGSWSSAWVEQFGNPDSGNTIIKLKHENGEWVKDDA